MDLASLKARLAKQEKINDILKKKLTLEEQNQRLRSNLNQMKERKKKPTRFSKIKSALDEAASRW